MQEPNNLLSHLLRCWPSMPANQPAAFPSSPVLPEHKYEKGCGAGWLFSARDLDHKYFVTSFFSTKVKHGGDNPERQLI